MVRSKAAKVPTSIYDIVVHLHLESTSEELAERVILGAMDELTLLGVTVTSCYHNDREICPSCRGLGRQREANLERCQLCKGDGFVTKVASIDT